MFQLGSVGINCSITLLSFILSKLLCAIIRCRFSAGKTFCIIQYKTRIIYILYLHAVRVTEYGHTLVIRNQEFVMFGPLNTVISLYVLHLDCGMNVLLVLGLAM